MILRRVLVGSSVSTTLEIEASELIAKWEARQQIVQHGHPISASVCKYICNASGMQLFVYVRVQYSAHARKRAWERDHRLQRHRVVEDVNSSEGATWPTSPNVHSAAGVWCLPHSGRGLLYTWWSNGWKEVRQFSPFLVPTRRPPQPAQTSAPSGSPPQTCPSQTASLSVLSRWLPPGSFPCPGKKPKLHIVCTLTPRWVYVRWNFRSGLMSAYFRVSLHLRNKTAKIYL